MYQRRNFLSTLPPVVLNLLAINVVVFILMLIPSAGAWFDRYFALYYFTSPGFRIYQLITYMFVHGGLPHLFFNMFALVMFGRTIEMSMGSARFLFYYITCGICAAFVQMGVFAIYISQLSSMLDPVQLHAVVEQGWYALQNGQNFIDPDMGQLNLYINTPMVGASGAIYGVLLAFGFLFPNLPIYLFFIPVPIKAKWVVVGYFVLELLFGLSGSALGVAHFAHLGGMIFGYLLLWYWKRKGIFNNRWFF